MIKTANSLRKPHQLSLFLTVHSYSHHASFFLGLAMNSEPLAHFLLGRSLAVWGANNEQLFQLLKY